MWSNVVLFWLAFGVVFTFWIWFFDVHFNSAPAISYVKFNLLSCVITVLTAMFVWSYATLYLSSIVTVASPLAEINLQPTNMPSCRAPLTMLDMTSFPFLLIFLLVTTISVVFCLCYNRAEIVSFSTYVSVIFFAGFMFFSASSLVTFFVSYELFLLPSFFILYKFAKTRRAIEAAYLMFFWTQFGALFLALSFLFIYYTTTSFSWDNVRNYNFTPWEVTFLVSCWFVGFGVKLPLWPFYGWLPKAHVEASTNFSIFLSGVLVKFAFFGLLRCLYILNLDVSCPFIIPFLAMGLVEASFKLLLQVDLKKLVAYATVIEMHWLTICITAGPSPLMLAGWAMLVNHALLSATAFLIVDSINRRFKTRLITEISGLNLLCPKLFIVAFINCLLFLGFPGSLTFVSEVLFFTFLIDILPLLFPLLLLFLYIIAPTLFFRSWFNMMFGSSTFSTQRPPVDITTREFLAISVLEALIFFFGFTWQTLMV